MIVTGQVVLIWTSGVWVLAIDMGHVLSQYRLKTFNTLRLRQNGQHFTVDILKHISFNENVWISIKISLKFVPKGPINKIPAMVQIMAWHRPGDKSLSKTMLIILQTHICITQPQWVKQLYHLFCFSKMLFYFLMLTMNVTLKSETNPMQWIFGRDCGYWWPGALAPGHQ